MANVQITVGTTDVLTVNFCKADGSIITPPSQYQFACSDPAITLGALVSGSLNQINYTGNTVKSGITVTVTCAGINNGTAPVFVDVIAARNLTETGNVIPGLPSSSTFQATTS